MITLHAKFLYPFGFFGFLGFLGFFLLIKKFLYRISSMTDLVKYILWPNLGTTTYDNPKVVAFFVVALGLIALSFSICMWRKGLKNSVTKKLSRSWASAALWFGISVLILTVSRVEGISYVSMRLWLIVWALILAIYIVFQIKTFRARHYEKIATEIVDDPLKKYLPKKKRR